MTLLAVLLSSALVALAALHIAWGIGFWFPIRDEAGLARAVIGAPGRDRMPGAVPCGLVAVALLAAVSVLWWEPGLLRSLAVFGAGLVFTVRGFAAWHPDWRRLVPQEPFATLDRRLYGPLCLGVGLSFWGTLL